MKRSALGLLPVALVLAALMAVVFAGCGGETGPASTGTVTEQEAMDIAQAECPTPEEWMEMTTAGHIGIETDVEASIDTRLRNETSEREAREVWWVEIKYELYPRDQEHNNDSCVDHKHYLFEIDASNGEIVYTDTCL